MTSSTDSVYIIGQLEPFYDQKGHIEQIQFTDTTMTIGSDTKAASLNAASTLSAGEKEKRSKAAKEIIEKAKEASETP